MKKATGQLAYYLMIIIGSGYFTLWSDHWFMPIWISLCFTIGYTFPVYLKWFKGR